MSISVHMCVSVYISAHDPAAHLFYSIWCMDAVRCRARGLSSSTCAASTVRVRRGPVTVGGGGDTGDDDRGSEW